MKWNEGRKEGRKKERMNLIYDACNLKLVQGCSSCCTHLWIKSRLWIRKCGLYHRKSSLAVLMLVLIFATSRVTLSFTNSHRLHVCLLFFSETSQICLLESPNRNGYRVCRRPFKKERREQNWDVSMLMCERVAAWILYSCPLQAKNFDASKADPYLGIVSPGLFDVEDGKDGFWNTWTGKANIKQHCSGIQRSTCNRLRECNNPRSENVVGVTFSDSSESEFFLFQICLPEPTWMWAYESAGLQHLWLCCWKSSEGACAADLLPWRTMKDLQLAGMLSSRGMSFENIFIHTDIRDIRIYVLICMYLVGFIAVVTSVHRFAMPGAGNCSRRGWELGNTMNIHEIREHWLRLDEFLALQRLHSAIFTLPQACRQRRDEEAILRSMLRLRKMGRYNKAIIQPMSYILKFSLAPQYLGALKGNHFESKDVSFWIISLQTERWAFRPTPPCPCKWWYQQAPLKFLPYWKVFTFITSLCLVLVICAQASEFALHWCCLQSILCWAWKGLAAPFSLWQLPNATALVFAT